MKAPIFSLLAERPKSVALLPGCPILRVWLPSRWRQLLSSPKASFSLPHSWGSPFRAFLSPNGRKRVSPFSLRSRAYYRNHSGLDPAPQRLDPVKRAVPLFATRMFSSGRGPCSLGPCDLSGFPFLLADRWSVSLLRYPSRSFSTASSQKLLLGTSGVSDLEDSAFPFTGRQPVWPFRPTYFSPLFGVSVPRGLFFRLEDQNPSQDSNALSLQRTFPA
jgi:hypothetical protein